MFMYCHEVNKYIFKSKYRQRTKTSIHYYQILSSCDNSDIYYVIDLILVSKSYQENFKEYF